MENGEAWAGSKEYVGIVVVPFRILLSGKTDQQDNNSAQKRLGSREIINIESHYMNYHHTIWGGYLDWG